MKVIIVDPAVRGGVVYYRYIDYARAIAKLGHACEYVLPKNIGKKSKFSAGSFLSVTLQLIKKKREYDTAIIPTKTMLWFYVWLLKFVLKKRVVIDHIASYVTIRERYGWFPGFLERWAYRHADAVVTFTHTMGRLVREKFGLPTKAMFLIYCLTDENLFALHAFRAEAAALKKEYGIEDKFVVFYHGMHNPWHGVDIILQAAKLLSDDTRFVFAFLPGKAEIDSTGYTNLLLLPEKKVAEVPPYLEMADIWISGVNNHHIAERLFATTMIQALLMGKPILTSRNEEKNTFFRDEATVVFVEPNSPLAIVEKLRYYSDHRDELRDIAARATMEVAPQFTNDRFVDTVHLIIES